MNKIAILLKKEITEILRDKKTLIIMIVMPLLLYPAILIGVSLGITAIMQSEEDKEHTVGYLSEDEEYVEPLISLYEEKKEGLDSKLSFKGADKEEEAALKEETDAWISFSKEAQSIQIQLDYTSTSQKSNYTESAIKELVDEYRDIIIAKNLEKEGLTKDFLYPVTYEAKDSATLSESVGMNMGGSIGMLIIIMILMGAFYPAVDITTGEKERGTLETLLTLPVTNFQMIMSKFIAASIIACITAVVTLISIGGSVLFMLLALPVDGMIELPVDTFLSSIPILLVVMITTALLLTALSMCFCVFAKSTKEANNYITPVMLIVMFASMIGMFPTVELDYKFAVIPIVNVTLLIKQVLAQSMDLSLTLITVLVNCAYSVLIIWILAKMYDSEDIMFSDGFKSFRLFQKREDIKKGTIPAIGDVIVSLVVLFLAIIYLGGVVSMRNQFLGTALIQLMIVAVPLALTWYMKSDVKELFCLKKPKMNMIAGSVLLYIGVFLVMLMLSIVLTKMFPDNIEGLEMAFDEMMKYPFVLLVLVIAVMPAIGEELLFRGLVFGSMKSRYKVVWGILVSALIFGAFHGNLVKLIPTAMLGACFAYVVYKSGSIFVSMCFHFVNNFVSVLVMKYPETIGKALPFMVKEDLSMTELMIMFAIGIVFMAAGLLLINKQSGKAA